MDREIEERFELLEKKVDDHDMIIESGLKQRIEKIEFEVSGEMINIDKIRKELSELKASSASHTVRLNTQRDAINNRNYKTIVEIREVLRELFDKMVEHYTSEVDKPFKYWRVIFEHLKAKLCGEKEGVDKKERCIPQALVDADPVHSKPRSITIGIDVKPEGITGKILENPSEQDLPPNMKKDFERMKEVAEPETPNIQCSPIEMVYLLKDTHILVAKEDLEFLVIALDYYRDNSDDQLICSERERLKGIEEKYLEEDKE